MTGSVAAAWLLVAGCIAGAADGGTDRVEGGELVEGTGTVVWRSVEGGVYVIEADDGSTYNPVDLPTEYQVDSLRVRFEVEIRTDLMGIHMVGQLVEIHSIEKL